MSSSTKLKKSLLCTVLLLLVFDLSLFGNEAFPKIFQQQLASMSYLQHPNPPRLIFLSGTFGMGKTYTAKKLEHHFKALRLSADEARLLFPEHGLPYEAINDYIEYALTELQRISPNRMIVLDRSCDRTYARYASFAQKYGLQNYLIRLVVPRDVVEQRIRSRGSDVENQLRDLDRAWNDYEKFTKNHTFDFILDNGEDENSNQEMLFKDIEHHFSFQAYEPGTSEYNQKRQEIIDFAEHAEPQLNENADYLSEILPGLYLASQVAADLIIKEKPPFISEMLTCRSEVNAPAWEELNWKGLQIFDFEDFDIIDYFEETFEFIEKTKTGILVHCCLGCSRSTTFVMAYLMKKFDLPFSVAFAYVKKKHPATNPNDGFIEQLQEYEEELSQRLHERDNGRAKPLEPPSYLVANI